MVISLAEKSVDLKIFLNENKVSLTDNIFLELLDFLSYACSYEEESVKIIPSLVIGNNLFSDGYFQKITQSTIINMITDKLDNCSIIKRLKSLLPFCNLGWRIYINFIEETVEFGIIRIFNGPSGSDVSDIIDNPDILEVMKFVLIDIVTSFDIMLRAPKSSLKLSFSFKSEMKNDALQRFANDIVEEYKDIDEKILNSYYNILKHLKKVSHGSICLLVKSDCVLPNDDLKDGVFLQEPIDIVDILKNELFDVNTIGFSKEETIKSHEKYHAFCSLFFQMNNIDGITIIDSKGKLRAFNVFVTPNTDFASNTSGGARKRAFNSLLKLKGQHYVSAYFQSQDGKTLYERISNDE